MSGCGYADTSQCDEKLPTQTQAQPSTIDYDECETYDTCDTCLFNGNDCAWSMVIGCTESCDGEIDGEDSSDDDDSITCYDSSNFEFFISSSPTIEDVLEICSEIVVNITIMPTQSQTPTQMFSSSSYSTTTSPTTAIIQVVTVLLINVVSATIVHYYYLWM